MPCALMGGGNHQVLAAKKYAMMTVNIQTTGASSIHSTPLRVPVPSTELTLGTKTITLQEGRATPFTSVSWHLRGHGAAWYAVAWLLETSEGVTQDDSPHAVDPE